jgi:hypothetical protein
MPDPSDSSRPTEPSGPFGEAPPGRAETPRPGDPRVEGTLTQVRVIAGALAGSVVVYAVLAWLVTGRGGGEAIGLPGMAVAVLAALGAFDLLLAPVIERALLANAGGEAMDRALAEYRKAKVVGFAFREAAAIFGLLIALFTGQPLWCYGLAAATLIAMALAWPSREELERVARGAVRPQ